MVLPARTKASQAGDENTTEVLPFFVSSSSQIESHLHSSASECLTAPLVVVFLLRRISCFCTPNI
jgi:hypothetical protein